MIILQETLNVKRKLFLVSLPVLTLFPTLSSAIVIVFPFLRCTLADAGKQPLLSGGGGGHGSHLSVSSFQQ